MLQASSVPYNAGDALRGWVPGEMLGLFQDGDVGEAGRHIRRQVTHRKNSKQRPVVAPCPSPLTRISATLLLLLPNLLKFLSEPLSCPFGFGSILYGHKTFPPGPT